MLKNFFRKNNPVDPQQELDEWLAKGKPFPPPHIVKQKVIDEYRSAYKTKTLVETGTYLGDMVAAQKNNFDAIYSIELSEKLYKKALTRFSDDKHVQLLQGDSGERLKEVVVRFSEPALFWLDGHYSGGITAKAEKECPVPEELHAILSSRVMHVILIDDARLFNGTHDYPTIDEIKKIIHEHGKEYSIENKDDILRLTPNQS